MKNKFSILVITLILACTVAAQSADAHSKKYKVKGLYLGAGIAHSQAYDIQTAFTLLFGRNIPSHTGIELSVGYKFSRLIGVEALLTPLRVRTSLFSSSAVVVDSAFSINLVFDFRITSHGQIRLSLGTGGLIDQNATVGVVYLGYMYEFSKKQSVLAGYRGLLTSTVNNSLNLNAIRQFSVKYQYRF